MGHMFYLYYHLKKIGVVRPVPSPQGVKKVFPKHVSHVSR